MKINRIDHIVLTVKYHNTRQSDKGLESGLP